MTTARLGELVRVTPNFLLAWRCAYRMGSAARLELVLAAMNQEVMVMETWGVMIPGMTNP
jgi:hypothetical protein